MHSLTSLLMSHLICSQNNHYLFTLCVCLIAALCIFSGSAYSRSNYKSLNAGTMKGSKSGVLNRHLLYLLELNLHLARLSCYITDSSRSIEMGDSARRQWKDILSTRRQWKCILNLGLHYKQAASTKDKWELRAICTDGATGRNWPSDFLGLRLFVRVFPQPGNVSLFVPCAQYDLCLTGTALL